VLVHEQAGGAGYINFRQLMQQTPPVLKTTPYSLYDTPATPLYPTPEHRRACMHSVPRELVAAENARAASRRFGQLASLARMAAASSSRLRIVRASSSFGGRSADKEEGPAVEVYGAL
jgi:hypothetical protein